MNSLMPSTNLQGRWGETRAGREPRETDFPSRIITTMQMASGSLEVLVLPAHAHLLIFYELLTPFLKQTHNNHMRTLFQCLDRWLFFVQVQIR